MPGANAHVPRSRAVSIRLSRNGCLQRRDRLVSGAGFLFRRVLWSASLSASRGALCWRAVHCQLRSTGEHAGLRGDGCAVRGSRHSGHLPARTGSAARARPRLGMHV